MSPQAIIQQAQADGVTLALTPAGTIRATGSSEAVNRWLPVIRIHKPEIVAEPVEEQPALDLEDLDTPAYLRHGQVLN